MKTKFILFILLLSINITNAQPTNNNYTQYVNPFLGTGLHGHTYPGATVPFGMVQLSPDNGRGGWDWCSGYHYSDSIIVGFSHTHLSGTGIGDLCDILFMPAILPGKANAKEIISHNYKSKFSHNSESAKPGYYSLQLDDYNIKSELTAALRSGMQRHTFNKKGKHFIILDLGYAVNWDKPTNTFIQIIDKQTIAGFRLSTGWAKDQRVYFYAKFSKPISKSYLIADSIYTPETKHAAGKNSKGIFEFKLKKGEQVLVKVGISSVDIEGAKLNLENDIKEWEFDQTAANADILWNKELSKIKVKSDDKNLLTTFYTALYRTMLAPVVFNDVNGNYKGADGKIHKAENYTKYSIFSLWDTFRAAHPLYTITQQERVSDMINSMLSHYDEYGLLPVWELLGNETGTMIGYHAIPVIADAMLKGFKGFDYNKAYTAMKKSAMEDHLGLKYYKELGFVPSDKEVESVSKTLEYAYDDWCIAAVAKYLGNEEDYKYFSARAQYYRNLFDPASEFMRAKKNDGRWKELFNPRLVDHRANEYTEGNAWQYSWFVPHDIQGFINLFKSNESFASKLDSLFRTSSRLEGDKVSPDISGMIGQYAHGNEPSHNIAYMFNYAGETWKTQYYVNKILTSQYNHNYDGLCGNEDCGQMSAWYVFSALGFYPVNPADQNYVIGTPLFDEVEIDPGNGKTFKLISNNLSKENIYVQSAKLNGAELTKSFITHNDLMNGGTFEFEMDGLPNKNLWTSYNACPPSATKQIDPTTINKNEYAEKVKQEFLHAWNAYKKYAWGKDQLQPMKKSGRNWYNESFLLTPVDAFTTMKLMNLQTEAEEAKQLILENLSFDKDVPVQIFEFTIRLLGGLISAYQLDGDERFLDLAEDLGNRFLKGFDSKTGMPYRFVNLKTGEVKDKINNPAEIGTLMIEFGALSKITDDDIYYETAKKAFVEVYNRRSKIGLVGTQINVETGEWTNPESHISGMIDSYYEYMLKGWLLFDDEDFKKMYYESIDAVNKYLWDSTETGYWYKRVDMNTGETVSKTFGALDAFMPAMIALGGDVERAEKLQESCYRMWTHFGIEPEEMNYETFEVNYADYVLRPEIIESAFYLYRYTKNPKYLGMGKTFYEGLVKYCKLDEGYASLKSVLSKKKRDPMESFFFAETLKYLYLIFAPEETLDLSKYVFSTEAHPIKKDWQ
ncbi:MAG: GH92 family glycosyl hydrolase [Bacteroidota bacterium]